MYSDYTPHTAHSSLPPVLSVTPHPSEFFAQVLDFWFDFCDPFHLTRAICMTIRLELPLELMGLLIRTQLRL